MRLDCECKNWADEFLCIETGSHHCRCPKYRRVDELLEIRKAILDAASAMEAWGGEEGGIPEFAWPAYEKLCKMCFKPVPEVSDD